MTSLPRTGPGPGPAHRRRRPPEPEVTLPEPEVTKPEEQESHGPLLHPSIILTGRNWNEDQITQIHPKHSRGPY